MWEELMLATKISWGSRKIQQLAQDRLLGKEKVN